MMWRIFRLELRVAFRHSAEIANPLWFFLIVITLFPLSIGPEPQLLARIAPGIIWVAALLASLLALERLFRDDLQDGSLEQLMLLPLPLPAVVLAKVMAHWVVTGLPLLILAVGGVAAGHGYVRVANYGANPAAWHADTGFSRGTGCGVNGGIKAWRRIVKCTGATAHDSITDFATAAMDAASMHLPVEGYMAILGALLVGSATLSPFATAAALRISVQ